MPKPRSEDGALVVATPASRLILHAVKLSCGEEHCQSSRRPQGRMWRLSQNLGRNGSTTPWGSMGKLRARCDGLRDRPSYASHQMRHAGDGSIVRGGVEECGTRIKFERYSFGLV